MARCVECDGFGVKVTQLFLLLWLVIVSLLFQSFFNQNPYGPLFFFKLIKCAVFRIDFWKKIKSANCWNWSDLAGSTISGRFPAVQSQFFEKWYSGYDQTGYLADSWFNCSNRTVWSDPIFRTILFSLHFWFGCHVSLNFANCSSFTKIVITCAF